MIICHSRKFIFVHVHKCAGSSVTAAIKPTLSSEDHVLGGLNERGNVSCDSLAGQLHKHSTAMEIREVVGADIWNSYFKFGCVRHPFDRIVSFYEFLNRICKKNAPRSFRSLFWPWKARSRQQLPDEAPWNWPGMKALLSTTSFSEFIRSEHLANEQGVNPQVVALADRDGKLLVDFVAKVENLEVDWEFLRQKTGVSTTLQLRNESAWRFPNARDYFGDGDIEYLASIYKDDFALFEYTC